MSDSIAFGEPDQFLKQVWVGVSICLFSANVQSKQKMFRTPINKTFPVWNPIIEAYEEPQDQK
jgi:hypothetical protein